MNRRAAVALVLALSLIAGACDETASTTSPPPASARPAAGRSEAVELTIFGAASLRGAFVAIEHESPLLFPGWDLTVTTDSSTTLATQIELGAQADVFLSADTENPRRLVAGGQAEGPPVAFATNAVVIVVAEANPLGIEARDLARPGLRILAAGPDVPITRYANQLVENLARLPGYPPDFVASYHANIVSQEENVAAVMAKMELGVADAAIVYESDAGQSILQRVEVPDAVAVRATYEGVVLRSARHPEAARRFLQWLVGPVGQEMLASSAFGPP